MTVPGTFNFIKKKNNKILAQTDGRGDVVFNSRSSIRPLAQ
jgi:hypothetical protein